jgi:two-component sensor histidine kinase
MRGICEITGVVAGGTFLLAALASYLLARHITEPIRSLQRFAHRVAAGAPAARVDIRSGDEIGDLAESINTMITSLALSQERLRQSLEEQSTLREKDILLREIHHRVKNNMQMLSSLMRLQARRASTTEAQQILRESEARIRSMGLIHEKLYQSESISAIDMHGYLKTLTDEILRMAGGPGSREIRIEIGNVALGLDTALPCGLIVTELVQNSLKYAFPDGRDGVILIRLTRIGQQFSLLVWDNGIGFPDDAKPTRGNSLGMRLVRMLTDQLHGELSMDGRQGTRVEITFEEPEYRERL